MIIIENLKKSGLFLFSHTYLHILLTKFNDFSQLRNVARLASEQRQDHPQPSELAIGSSYSLQN